jgi:hypothetical protein
MGELTAGTEAGYGVMQREYQLERDELKGLLIEYNIGGKEPAEIISVLDTRGRRISMIDFIKMLGANGAETQRIIDFLKRLGIPDLIITRILGATRGAASIGVER